MTNMLKKWFTKSQQGEAGVIALLAEAVYWQDSQGELHTFPITATPGAPSDWTQALNAALEKVKPHSRHLTVLLGSHYYQVLQIDKPKIPSAEWPKALPYLLKDLLSEKPSEVVASAVSLPFGGKIQAYVLSKSILNPLLRCFDEHQFTLNALLPDDEIWGYSSDELANFMLLQRSDAGAYKLSAFVAHVPVFQRTLRAIFGPLTGENGSESQLDTVALELQRSMDYVSAQAKGVAFNQLKVCCDGEEIAELVDALNARLIAKVTPLQQAALDDPSHLQRSVQRLLCSAKASREIALDLYPESLRPQRQRMTLPAVALGWAALFVVLSGYSGWLSYHHAQLEQQVTQQKQQNSALSTELEQINQAVAKHQADPQINAAIARVQQDIQGKRDAIAVISDYETRDHGGYSDVLYALANLPNQRIALTQISMSHQQFDLQGEALSASAVPEWVGEFKQQVALVGRSFESVTIRRDEQTRVWFELRSQSQEAK
ncbi:MSHA biogenesis protein MshI [Vibrio sp. SM6]|uniref:MSHA biogenesis protein MshI n=1 Tax=Vibrio agarilyticus TaxID=2726741 RepID=A0A7X8TUL6_9VIBR|nr:MSHA biogenesis protein MshI [Vibrio agarilyticus]NLS14593.1 MSHA biogenesis protein MshI [Vibrio agarilyticus]